MTVTLVITYYHEFNQDSGQHMQYLSLRLYQS